jgi:hypothetical protein
MYQEPGLAWLERQAEAAEQLLAERQAADHRWRQWSVVPYATALRSALLSGPSTIAWCSRFRPWGPIVVLTAAALGCGADHPGGGPRLAATLLQRLALFCSFRAR